MKQAIHLVRLSLAVQLALAVFALASDVIASGFSFASPQTLIQASALTREVIAVNLLGTLPVIVLFAVAWAPDIMAPRRGVQIILVLMIAAFTWQISVPNIAAMRLTLTNPAIGKPLYEIVVGGESPASLVASPTSAVLLFALLPAVIGAWLGGKRTAIRWALVASAFSVSSAVFMRLVMPQELVGDDRIADTVVWLTGQCIVIGMTCYFVGALSDWQREERTRVEQANAQLAEANRQLAQQATMREQLAASRERMQLARDLHDTLAHTLAGLTVQLDAVNAIVGMGGTNDSVVKAELARASELAHDGLDTARNAITGLRADPVSELGLCGAIRRRLQIVERNAKVQGDLVIECGEPVVDGNGALSLYGIAQEALNNVERHANAQHVHAVLSPHSLIIDDDGIGFDSLLPRERYGLRGMRERAAEMGAQLTLRSRIGTGTTVEVHW